jgi:hypothetical protein
VRRFDAAFVFVEREEKDKKERKRRQAAALQSSHARCG